MAYGNGVGSDSVPYIERAKNILCKLEGAGEVRDAAKPKTT